MSGSRRIRSTSCNTAGMNRKPPQSHGAVAERTAAPRPGSPTRPLDGAMREMHSTPAGRSSPKWAERRRTADRGRRAPDASQSATGGLARGKGSAVAERAGHTTQMRGSVTGPRGLGT
jgi:hypothetical protein